MDNEYFWTKETEQAIMQWIETAGKDDILYQDHIYNPLLFFARYVIGTYARDIRAYADSKEDLAQELVCQTSSALLTKFNVTKCKKSMMNFVYTVMKNHIHKLYNQSNQIKRTGTVISINRVNREDLNYIEEFLYENAGHDNGIDPEARELIINYLEKNTSVWYGERRQNIIRLILAIIKNPQNHHLKLKGNKSGNYTSYICKKAKISKQGLYDIYEDLKEKVKEFLEQNKDLL